MNMNLGLYHFGSLVLFSYLCRLEISMRKYFIILIYLLLGLNLVHAAEIKPKHLPQKSLQSLSSAELNVLFAEANNAYKLQDMQQFASDMRYRLNGAVMIAQGDSILVQKSFGYLQLYRRSTGYGKKSYRQLAALRGQSGNKLTNSTLFDMASVSKQFTAAAVLKLCSQNKLKLSDTIGKFLPQLPYGNVTINQLLTHTSGLPEYFDFPYTYYVDSIFYVDNDQLMRVLSEKKFPKVFPSGSKFSYTNTNYAILATIVAQVSGTSFEKYVHQNIWAPADMKNTCFFTELDSLDKQDSLHARRVARGHWSSGAFVVYDRLNGVLGDKCVYSNMQDLFKWERAYLKNYKVLPKEWVNKATSLQDTLTGGQKPREIYGYGFRIEENPYYGKLVYHGGLWGGFQNLFLYRPSDDLFIVFLSNYYNAAHRGKSNSVLHIVDGA